MPTLITGSRLREAVENGTFIKGGDIASVEGVKYDFHMGSRVLKASFATTIDIAKLPETERANMRIDPGEVVFVFTKETLHLSPTMVAVLSPKRTLTHSGIVVLGGFAIDPKWNGPLWMGLYNLSSTPFPLRPGRKLIAAMFYGLEGEEIGEFPTPEPGGDDFPDELITLIKNYKPIELRGLQDEIEETKRQLAVLRTEVAGDRDWRATFKEGLDRHGHQIEQLIEGLKEERELRRQEDTRVSGNIERLQRTIAGIRVGWYLILFLLGVAVTAGVEWVVPKAIEYFHSVAPITTPTGPPAVSHPAPAPPASPVGR